MFELIATTILIVGLILAGWFLPRFLRRKLKETLTWVPITTQFTIWSLAFLSFISLSIISISDDEVGLLSRRWGTPLEEGAIIARTDFQRGPQADILGPGFNFIPFVKVIYDVTTDKVVEIPEDHYGLLVARDGAPLPAGMLLAPAFPEDREAQFLDARTFLAEGGIKGPQLTILRPGKWRLNTFLWDVKTSAGDANARYTVTPEEALEMGIENFNTRVYQIPAGYVGVVKSNVSEPGRVCRETEETVVLSEGGVVPIDALTAPLVPKGCAGIWNEVLTPGAYYLNRMAYEGTLVDTRVQTWDYCGGYIRKVIDLTVDQEGKITQTFTERPISVPSTAADEAVSVKVEGWTVYQELRVLVQISPENAPVVVAAVGSLADVENRVVTPAIRAVVRDVLGGVAPLPSNNQLDDVIVRPVRILDLTENRAYLQAEVEQRIRIEAQRAGLAVRQVQFGNPDIPPELLVARKREQLATQLRQAYIEEERAQEQRILVEQAKATANQQKTLVAQQINVEVSELKIEQRTNEGAAEQAYLMSLAAGEQARVNVLGPDKVLMLNIAERFLAAISERPEIIANLPMPNTVVLGSGGGLEGAAAVLSQALSRPSLPSIKE